MSESPDDRPTSGLTPPAAGAGKPIAPTGMIALPLLRLIRSLLGQKRPPTGSPSPGRKGPRPPILLLVLLLVLAGCGVPGTIGTGGTLPAIPPTPTATVLPPVQFPRDEAPHANLTEWWYYTGHLRATDAQGHAHDYGFELTFFQTLRGQLPPYYAAHFAVSDLTRGQFHYDQRAAFEPDAGAEIATAGGAGLGFNLALGDWSIEGLNGHDTLAAAMSDYALALTARDELPRPVLHGGSGLISYGAAGYSYYYSRPLLAVSGTLTDHGAPLTVTGTAWMDHQWGNFITVNGTGWDWYSIQLADHTEYMLYVILDAQKRPGAAFGTAIAPNGTASEIPPSAIHITEQGTWTSPQTGGVYPSGWRVTIAGDPALTLTLTPQLKDQELVTAQSTGNAYWEGAVRIAGDAAGQPISGQGYVELTGYASVPSAVQGTATATPLP